MGTNSWTSGGGPLAPFADGYKRKLVALGHKPTTVRQHLRLDPERLDADDFLLFVAHRTGDIHHVNDERVAFRPLLRFSRKGSVCLRGSERCRDSPDRRYPP